MKYTSWIFTWKGHLFVSLIDKDKILLKWTSVGLKELSKPLLEKDQFNILNSPEQTDVDDVTTTKTASFVLDNDKEFKFLTYGFSFDPGCLDDVPFMVVHGSNSGPYSTKAKGNKRSDVCLLLSLRSTTPSFGELEPEAAIVFEFVQLGTYDLTRKQRNLIVDQSLFEVNNFKVASFFQMLSLDLQASNLDVYSTSGISSYSFFNPDERHFYKQYTALDTFCNNAAHETYVLFSCVDDRHNKPCKTVNCIKFQHRNHQSQPEVNMSDSNSPLESVPQEYLFPPDYSQLIVSVKLISIASGQAKGTKKTQYKSSLIIVTNTGYLLHFVDGSMSLCIHIWNDLQEICSFTEPDWATAKFDFVIMRRGSAKRIAVQVNSACVLVDAEKEQVIKVWQSVSFISKIVLNQVPRLLILMDPTSDNDQNLCDLIGDKENIDLIDCFRVNSRGEIESDLQRQVSEESSRSENQMPQFAVDALLAQKKKYEISMKEAEIGLAAKEQFLVETLEALQNMSVATSEGQPLCKDPRLIPLIGDAQESDKKMHTRVLPSHSEHISQKSYSNEFRPSSRKKTTTEVNLVDRNNPTAHITVVGEPWKRTIESLLVVGLHVRNVCDRPLVGAHIHLIPAGICSFTMLECVSSEGPSSLENENTSSSMFTTSTESSVHIQPGHERTLTCYVDTEQVLSPSDLKFSLVLSFSLNNSSPRNKKSSHEQRQENEVLNVSCGDIILSTQDVISAKYSIERMFRLEESEPSDYGISILALDCVQQVRRFVVKSIISSVLCLESKLKSNDMLLNVCGCYIFVADHQLRLCRVKVLQQLNKKEGKLQIWTRTESQTLLFVKFLQSILPDDMTLLPDLAPTSLALQQAREVLGKEIKNRISEIKEELAETAKDQPMELSLTESEIESGEPALSSPTFHSKKSVWNRSGLKDSSKVNDGGDKKRIKGKVDADGSNRVNEERKKFLTARKKLNEKLGMSDS